MALLPTRRALLRAAASAGITSTSASWLGGDALAATHDRLARLEAATAVRLGVAALNTANGASLSHRARERFPFCSTFKLLAASAILRRSATEPGLLQRRIAYAASNLVAGSPITSQHAGDGMTVAELCAAALQYSDNTAANLMLWLLGGPYAVTAFARLIGDATFRLDRWETALNTAIPGDARDTSTPAAMMQDLHRLALGDALGLPQREQLVAWMRGNTTGATRIRSGLPAGWSVADKTGTGDYGTANDIAVTWPPGKKPIVLAIYVTQHDKNAPPRDDILASAAKIVIETFGGA
jgi:beta-lactamase class A